MEAQLTSRLLYPFSWVSSLDLRRRVWFSSHNRMECPDVPDAPVPPRLPSSVFIVRSADMVARPICSRWMRRTIARQKRLGELNKTRPQGVASVNINQSRHLRTLKAYHIVDCWSILDPLYRTCGGSTLPCWTAKSHGGA